MITLPLKTSNGHFIVTVDNKYTKSIKQTGR